MSFTQVKLNNQKYIYLLVVTELGVEVFAEKNPIYPQLKGLS